MENIGSDLGTKLGESGESLVLGFDMNFADLYQRTGLLKLDHAFLDFLKSKLLLRFLLYNLFYLYRYSIDVD